MRLQQVAACLAELGHPKRLQIFKLLVSCGAQGIETGKIATQLAIPNSTLSHHLRKLADANLIKQSQVPPKIFCQANCHTLRLVINFLSKNCCEPVESNPNGARSC